MLDKSRFDGALNQFFQLYEAFPDDYELHKDISWKLYEIKYIESTTFLERTVALNPYDAESWAALGHVYRKLKKYNESINAYQQALSIEVDNTTFMFNLSRVYIESRKWQLAREQLERLLELAPDMVIAIQAMKFVSSTLKQ